MLSNSSKRKSLLDAVVGKVREAGWRPLGAGRFLFVFGRIAGLRRDVTPQNLSVLEEPSDGLLLH